jgi:hypothetical protein
LQRRLTVPQRRAFIRRVPRQRSGRTGLNFERPRGCDICHHQAPVTSRCASCHDQEQMGKPVTIPVHLTVPREPERLGRQSSTNPAAARVLAKPCAERGHMLHRSRESYEHVDGLHTRNPTVNHGDVNAASPTRPPPCVRGGIEPAAL